MRKSIEIMSDLGSILLAFGLYAYFVYGSGHSPETAKGTMIGIGLTLLIAVAYGFLESLPVMRGTTPQPLYLAVETFISYTPLFSFCVIWTKWGHGLIEISAFQWIVTGIFLLVILLDVLGFVTIMAQRLLLTDEYKTVK